ncbi:MAG TPA: hypothetical protein PLL30_08810 [Candidatus Krumholzibacteria bacterium]|nr:hypothetical protein [Candidatus Krumholzibacteria bacterium]HPD71859.1 hypothetical protein [Candidatus Krumholzibacteria bacterium]HRY41208.1 hypothetical protein [Candidatus Krumholzibacteria bacterium]
MTLRRAFPLAPTLGLLLAAVAGCGEKIGIPQPEGLFSVAPYLLSEIYDDDDPRQLISSQGNLFVLADGTLTKRNQSYERLARIEGFADPRALCAGDYDSLVFVWDQGPGRVSWFRTRDLSVQLDQPSHTDLPAVRRCVAMAACRAGIEQVPGATTYLYLADPDSGVVHRYAYDPYTGLVAHGILCRRGGDAARFVHDPGALARDSADSLLVCDVDTLRNWVIRFNSVPDLLDTAPGGVGPDPLRGHAALFAPAACNPPAADEYVLGDAAGCNETDWVGGPSDAEGEFTTPQGVAVDGSGRIFVSDTGNDRIQIFGPDGGYRVLFGNPDWSPAPGGLTTVDIRTGVGETGVKYGAYVYVVAGGQVRRFISGEYYDYVNANLPPDP